MKRYYKDKTEVVDAVSGMLPFLGINSASIITIKLVKSGDYSVRIAIEGSSDDMSIRYFSLQPMTIFDEGQAYSSQSE